MTGDIRTYTKEGITTVERSDLGVVAARYWKRGNWSIELYDGNTIGGASYATREAAESVALKHARSL